MEEVYTCICGKQKWEIGNRIIKCVCGQQFPLYSPLMEPKEFNEFIKSTADQTDG